jgi:hypothetical protein
MDLQALLMQGHRRLYMRRQRFDRSPSFANAKGILPLADESLPSSPFVPSVVERSTKPAWLRAPDASAAVRR